MRIVPGSAVASRANSRIVSCTGLNRCTWPLRRYYIVATITTVGYGDFAPTSQLSRAFSLVLMPLGLIIIGFGLS